MGSAPAYEPESSIVLVISEEYSVSQLPLEALALNGVWFLEESATIDFRAFTDTVLAACWDVGAEDRTVKDVRALPWRVRQRMLRDVVKVNRLSVPWRELRGSGMTLDQRLYEVVRERWQKHQLFIERIAKRHVDLACTEAFEGQPGGVVAKVTGGVFAPALDNLLKGVSPAIGPLGAATAAERLTRGVACTMMFRGVFDGIERLQYLTNPLKIIESSVGSVAFNNSALTKLTAGSDLVAGFSRISNTVTGLDRVSEIVRLGVPAFDLGPVSKVLENANWFERFALPPGLFEALRHGAEKATEYERRWDGHRYGFFVAGLLVVSTARDLGLLDALDVAASTEAFLRILENVATDTEFVLALRDAVRVAPYLNAAHRDSLDAALEAVAERRWVNACNGFYPGLEGAFLEAALASRVIADRDRTDPNDKNKQLGFETVVKRLPYTERSFKTWVANAVFGTAGNPYRHGSATDGHRRQALFAMVALAGWLQSFTPEPAWDYLVESARPHISDAAAHVQSQLLTTVP